MAVALRDLDRRPPRRPPLRVVDRRLRPPTPRGVYRMRRLIVLLILVSLVGGGIAMVRALSNDAPSATTRFEMTVVVPSDGTLWDLARMYAPGQDRAAWISQVAERNAVDPAAVQPGTPLTVPVEIPRVSAEVHGVGDQAATLRP